MRPDQPTNRSRNSSSDKNDGGRRRLRKKKSPIPNAVDSALGRWTVQREAAAAEKEKVRPRRPKARLSSDPALLAIQEAASTPLGREWLLDEPEITEPEDPEDVEGVIGPLPRRKLLVSVKSESHGIPAMKKALHFEAGAFRTSRRLVVWLFGALKLLGGELFDRLLGRHSDQRSAVRLRRLLESMGPTFTKLGQQLSVRADFLPYAYCEELAKMLDRQPPFPTQKAIEIIERTTGKPLADTFAIFDPVPIGAASIACVFQAVLPSGEFVAVKVRRPGIGEQFAADLRALDWLLSVAELLTLIRPGMTSNVRQDLKAMLFEELNYILEARYTELFAQRARTRGQSYIHAPKVYFDISSEEVLVTEFVSGVFLSEILGAMDRGDEAAIENIKALDIDPVELARRMARAFNWETLEGLLFHADPHPANIIVRPGNHLVFIDFGSCGRFSSKMRRLWMRLQKATEDEDGTEMVETAISFLEPLPPIDLDPLMKELEALFWDWLCAKKSKHSEWWERCTGDVWMKVIWLARRYNVPMNIDTLRLFRAAFLYDSIAVRLWNGLDLTREYVAYSKERGKRRRTRVRRRIKRLIEHGPTDKDYLRIAALGHLGGQMINRVQHILDNPKPRFTDIIGKAAFAVSMALKVITLGAGVHLVGVLFLSAFRAAAGEAVSLGAILSEMLSSTPYRVIVAVVMLVVIRKSLMRLEDPEVESK